jgi:prepilin-type N-terminal cleavage/methylation domain-containing protein
MADNILLPRARRGFTLMELLIVITILAILALLIIPKLIGAGRRAQESALSSNLYQMRLGIQKFQADTGINPAQLTDLVAPLSSPPTVGAGGISIPANTYKGPYYTLAGGLMGTGLPPNPFMTSSTPGYTDINTHWSYDPNSGNVWAAYPTGNNLDGVPYSNL